MSTNVQPVCEIKDCGNTHALLNVHPNICYFHAAALGLIAEAFIWKNHQTGGWGTAIPTTFN